jgi:hypothetical protein
MKRTGPATSLLLLAIFCSARCLAAPAWQAGVTKDPPGNFPPLRPFLANYRFGWSGFSAATGEVHFTNASENRFQVEATGRSIGFVRALWRMDVSHHALADAQTLRPIEMKQVETYRKKKLSTELAFSGNRVTRVRSEGTEDAKGKAKEYTYPNLYDLFSTALYLRSQPLHDHAIYRVVVFPATSAYLATLTVLDREKITVHAGSYKAIKVDLQLSKVGKNLELEPHKKFRRASIWISDDSDRILLRAEAQIFVGTVFAELQSIRFENPKS